MKRNVFLEYLVDGKADLYYFPANYFFIETEDKELKLLENTEFIFIQDGKDYIKQRNEYIAFMNMYMDDCPQIWDDIHTARLSQKNLVKITTKYHDLVCPDEECII